MKQDDFGDRMKKFEAALENRAASNQYIVIRADGRAFSKFTSNYKKPFDERITCAMDCAASITGDEFGADAVYVQSDEISFLFAPHYQRNADILREHMFSGRVQKLSSLIASSCSVLFNKYVKDDKKIGIFDARAMILNSNHEAANAIYWRALDARRNAVSGFYRYQFGHKKMQNKSEMEMLKENETTADWQSLSDFLKYGRLFVKDDLDPYLTYKKISGGDLLINSDHAKRLSVLTIHENKGTEK